jgi:hypothetical protein
MNGHNNPIRLAFSEARNLWYNSANPDIILSLGTGSKTTDFSPKLSKYRNVVLDGFLSRVTRSWISSFDGEQTWREFWSTLSEAQRKKTFRLNSSFPAAQPAMDNPSSMEHLSSWVKRQPKAPQQRETVIISLLCASFFFQLDGVPQFRLGMYHCTGTIRCRAVVQPVIRCLLRLCPDIVEIYKDKVNLGLRLSEDDICSTCHRYVRHIRFYVRQLNEEMALSFRVKTGMKELSSFPNNINWFIEKQGLDCIFGSPNHDMPLKPSCDLCEIDGTEHNKKRKYVEI